TRGACRVRGSEERSTSKRDALPQFFHSGGDAGAGSRCRLSRSPTCARSHPDRALLRGQGRWSPTGKLGGTAGCEYLVAKHAAIIIKVWSRCCFPYFRCRSCCSRERRCRFISLKTGTRK